MLFFYFPERTLLLWFGWAHAEGVAENCLEFPGARSTGQHYAELLKGISAGLPDFSMSLQTQGGKKDSRRRELVMC